MMLALVPSSILNFTGLPGESARAPRFGGALSSMGYMGVYSMGTTSLLTVVLSRHDDGCVIMEWDYESPIITIGDSYHRWRDITFASALQCVTNWMLLVESGDLDAQALFEQLELPFG